MSAFSTVKNALALTLLMPLLLGCIINTTPAPEPAKPVVRTEAPPPVAATGYIADSRSDEELLALLSPKAFNQKEFPKSMIASMLRTCIDRDNNEKSERNIVKKAGKVDAFCTCLTQKRVHAFTLDEYLQAGSAHWDMNADPKAVSKSNAIRAACFQRVLN